MDIRGDPKAREYQGRYEVAIDSQVELRKYPPSGRAPGQAPWTERLKEARASSDPITVQFEGRRFTWHPGSGEIMTVVSVMIEDADNYLDERFAMERFLSALSYLHRGAISIYTASGSSFKDELAPPRLRQPRMLGPVYPVSEKIELADESDELSLCLGLMREGLSSTSRALAFLSYWKAVEVAIGQGHLPDLLGDSFDRLHETRIAAAHAIPSNDKRLRYHPDDPGLGARLNEDAQAIHGLARQAINERWPHAVREKGQQFAT